MCVCVCVCVCARARARLCAMCVNLIGVGAESICDLRSVLFSGGYFVCRILLVAYSPALCERIAVQPMYGALSLILALL